MFDCLAVSWVIDAGSPPAMTDAHKIWLNSRLAGFVRLDEKAIQSTKQSSAASEGEDMESIGGCTSGLAASVRQPSFQSPAFALLSRKKSQTPCAEQKD